MLLIKTKAEGGFYRAGLRFTQAGERIDPKTLSNAQLDAIRAEPMLSVEEVKPESAPKPEADMPAHAPASKGKKGG